MSKAINNYLDIIHAKLDDISSQMHMLEEAAAHITTGIMKGQSIYVFGASHAGILTEELTYRAGGLALINPIFNPSLLLNVTPITLTSDLEKMPEFGDKIIRSSGIKQDDVLLLHSVSGRNPVVIDAALSAKSMGAMVIALTSVNTSRQVHSKHDSGKLLIHVADYVIDNLCDYGDACVSINGLPQKAAPLSTILGATIVNSLMLRVSERLMESGVTPPILASANLEGNELINQAIFEKFANQIHYL
ncbi:SIS domain-containing protein [Aeromonas enteropelogenes]|uniref:SIS domain-containing protein n=1 Tax=Aeromonas enteropelogenes TaxID=29489 RepID=UPI003136E80B